MNEILAIPILREVFETLTRALKFKEGDFVITDKGVVAEIVKISMEGQFVFFGKQRTIEVKNGGYLVKKLWCLKPVLIAFDSLEKEAEIITKEQIVNIIKTYKTDLTKMKRMLPVKEAVRKTKK